MASRSRDALPVLEWHDDGVSGQRPSVCGVMGCAGPLVILSHVQSRLCAAHIKCDAVLRCGEPQRWCGICRRFHELEAFSGSQRCTPASRLQRALFHPQNPATFPYKHLCSERCPDLTY
jgi:hypothetical protein